MIYVVSSYRLSYCEVPHLPTKSRLGPTYGMPSCPLLPSTCHHVAFNKINDVCSMHYVHSLCHVFRRLIRLKRLKAKPILAKMQSNFENNKTWSHVQGYWTNKVVLYLNFCGIPSIQSFSRCNYTA